MSGSATPNLQATEARILEVAGRLFHERGYKATTMRDLATEVGIKAASVYNHFASKQEILVRICLDGMREFYAGALARIEGVDDVRERLRALIVWQVVSETRYPYAGRVSDEQMHALNVKSRRELLGLWDAFEALVDDLLSEGQAQEIWRLSHPRLICLGVIGMCKIDRWYDSKGPLTPEQIGEIYATFILDALTCTAAQR